jgi:hypothetical protein
MILRGQNMLSSTQNHLPIHANLLPQHLMIINYIHKGHHVRIFEKKRKKLWQQHLVTVVSVAK